MESDVIELSLREDFLPGETIWLQTGEYDEAEREEFESLDGPYPCDLLIDVRRGTGRPLLFVVEGFITETEEAVQALRDNPLPWLFSLPLLKITEKPLEDVLYAVWEKYRDITMVWD